MSYINDLPIDIITDIAKYLGYENLSSFDKVTKNIDYCRLFYEYKYNTNVIMVKLDPYEYNYGSYFSLDENKKAIKDNYIYKVNNCYKILYSMILENHEWLFQLRLQSEILKVCPIELYKLIIDNDNINLEIEYSPFGDNAVSIRYFNIIGIADIIVRMKDSHIFSGYILFLYDHKNSKQICDYLYKNFAVRRCIGMGDEFYPLLDSMFESMKITNSIKMGVDFLEYIVNKYPDSINLYDDCIMLTLHLRCRDALELSIKILKNYITNVNEIIENIFSSIEVGKSFVPNDEAFEISNNEEIFDEIVDNMRIIVNRPNADHKKEIIDYLDKRLDIFKLAINRD